MLVSEYLVAAKAVIANPENWTKGYYAMARPIRDINERTKDDYLSVDDPRAVCFCSMGALEKVALELAGSDWSNNHDVTALYDRALDMLTIVLPAAEQAGLNDVVAFNDRSWTTHKDVIDAFDRAIAAAANPWVTQ